LTDKGVLDHPLNVAPHAVPVAPASAAQSRLRQIVADHFEVLWRFLRRLGLPEGDVDDAAQEVVLVLARKLEQVELGSERSFVLSTAFRVASGFRRRTRRRREVDEAPLLELASPELDPEARAEQRRLRELLTRVLDELPLELRAVFVLYELEELTMAEIARSLELPPGTVASRLRRSREAFERLAAEALGAGGVA
jgi:RNA polymerase sigma-70 factor (ECF subfamily)